MRWSDCSTRERRGELAADTIAHLGSAIAGALHEVYIIAGVLAVLTLAVVAAASRAS